MELRTIDTVYNTIIAQLQELGSCTVELQIILLSVAFTPPISSRAVELVTFELDIPNTACLTEMLTPCNSDSVLSPKL